MYLDYWNLRKRPFENTPDCRFLYLSQNHEGALRKLLFTIAYEKGCAMLTGELGCGKTILIRALLDQLDREDYEVALVNFPVFTRDECLKDILLQFGQETESGARVDLFRETTQFFYEKVSQGKKNILVIDEAQLLEDPAVFEELRLILNSQLEDRFLVSILLVGQPELREKVARHPPLDQQIAVKCHLQRFDLEDTFRYVRHRLEVAGCQREIFSEEALYLIFKLSTGIPRRINNVADLCLLEGFTRQVEQIESEMFESVV
jgi:type II secretory pathway predicted ATPase ExeA